MPFHKMERTFSTSRKANDMQGGCISCIKLNTIAKDAWGLQYQMPQFKAQKLTIVELLVAKWAKSTTSVVILQNSGVKITQFLWFINWDGILKKTLCLKANCQKLTAVLKNTTNIIGNLSKEIWLYIFFLIYIYWWYVLLSVLSLIILSLSLFPHSLSLPLSFSLSYTFSL